MMSIYFHQKTMTKIQVLQEEFSGIKSLSKTIGKEQLAVSYTHLDVYKRQDKFCKSVIPLKSIAACSLPELLVPEPQVIAEPIFTKEPVPI